MALSETSRRNERGFTLLEALISMVIFFIGATGVMRLQLESIRVNRFGGHMTQAMMFADERAQALLALDFDDPLIADSNGGNNPPAMNQAFPFSTPSAATPDTAEGATTSEGLTVGGTVVALNSGEQFQRYWMISDEEMNPTISGPDCKRIRVMVRFRDGESADWREAGVTVLKAKVQ